VSEFMIPSTGMASIVLIPLLFPFFKQDHKDFQNSVRQQEPEGLFSLHLSRLILINLSYGTCIVDEESISERLSKAH